MRSSSAVEAQCTLNALRNTRKQACLAKFMKVDGLRILDHLLRKFSLKAKAEKQEAANETKPRSLAENDATRETKGAASVVLGVLRAVERLPLSAGSVTKCEIAATLAETAQQAAQAIAAVEARIMQGHHVAAAQGEAEPVVLAAEEQLLSVLKEVAQGAAKGASSLEAKVKSLKMLAGTSIKKASSAQLQGPDLLADVGNQADRSSSCTVFIGGIPNLWGRRKVLELLMSSITAASPVDGNGTSNGIGINPSDIRAIEMGGVYGRGLSCFVQFDSERVLKDHAQPTLLRASSHLLATAALQEPLIVELCGGMRAGMGQRRDSVSGAGGYEPSPQGPSPRPGSGGGRVVSGYPAPSPLLQQTHGSQFQQPAVVAPASSSPVKVVEVAKVTVKDGHAVFREQIAGVVRKQLSKYHRFSPCLLSI